MGSYWAGYSGTGLVLTESEFDEMIECYKRKNPNQKEIIDEAIEDCTIEEIEFITSKYAGISVPELNTIEGAPSKYDDLLFSIDELSTNIVDGVTFFPFYKADGTPNVNRKNEDGRWESSESSHPIWDSEADRCYFLVSDKDMSSVKAFDKKPYDSYQDFMQEFKDKVEDYLPKDFDWNAHLGQLFYAAFA